MAVVCGGDVAPAVAAGAKQPIHVRDGRVLGIKGSFDASAVGIADARPDPPDGVLVNPDIATSEASVAPVPQPLDQLDHASRIERTFGNVKPIVMGASRASAAGAAYCGRCARRADHRLGSGQRCGQRSGQRSPGTVGECLVCECPVESVSGRPGPLRWPSDDGG